jgi:hypothetical protein
LDRNVVVAVRDEGLSMGRAVAGWAEDEGFFMLVLGQGRMTAVEDEGMVRVVLCCDDPIV